MFKPALLRQEMSSELPLLSKSDRIVMISVKTLIINARKDDIPNGTEKSITTFFNVKKQINICLEMFDMLSRI